MNRGLSAAIAFCFGGIVAGTMPLSAEVIDTFTFATPPQPPYGDSTPDGWNASGSFSIPASDFSGTGSVTIPNSDITALSFTLTYPGGSIGTFTYPGGSVVFDLADVSAGGTSTFTVTGSSPPVLYDGAGFLAAIGEANILIAENIVPGLWGFLGGSTPLLGGSPPLAIATDVAGYWTTTQTGTAPEPSTWAMMLLGFAGLSFARWRWSRKAASIAA
jgi:hypothetical protein